jgi:hypothetical protein
MENRDSVENVRKETKNNPIQIHQFPNNRKKKENSENLLNEKSSLI